MRDVRRSKLVHYDPDYCQAHPYIMYIMRYDSYIMGGEYKTFMEAWLVRVALLKKYKKCALEMTQQERLDALYEREIV